MRRSLAPIALPVLSVLLVIPSMAHADAQLLPPIESGTTNTPCLSGAGSKILTWDGQTNLKCNKGITVDASGNVGIGTTTPTAKMHIYDGIGHVTFGAPQSGGGYTLYSWANSLGGHIQSANLGTAWANILLNENAGNVGIGTTYPQYTLDVGYIAPGSIWGGGNIRANGTVFVKDCDAKLATQNPATGANSDVIGTYCGWGSNVVYIAGYNASDAMGVGSTRYVSMGGWGPGSSGSTLTADLVAHTVDIRGAGQALRLYNINYGDPWIVGPDWNDNFVIYNQYGTGVWVANGGVSWNANSDERLKTNVQALSEKQGLAGILELKPITYNWIDSKQAKQPHIGLIAQEVQKVFPSFVSKGADTTITRADGSKETVKDVLGVDYSGLVVPMIKAIQELKATNDELKKTNEKLEARLEALEAKVK